MDTFPSKSYSLSTNPVSNFPISELSDPLVLPTLLNFIINDSTSESCPLAVSGKGGIPRPQSQPREANRLARLRRARFALQCPFHSSAVSSAWEGTHCQPENEISGSVNVSRGLWCWKYYLWRKHYPVTELKAPRFWEEYQCSVSGKKKRISVLSTADFTVFSKQILVGLEAVRTLSDSTFPHHHQCSLLISSSMTDS